MKIMTVVGARPQFIKAAVVSKEMRKVHTEILVHTGQHYDYNMSQTFFEELDIPKPDYNLGIAGGSHAQMTGKMMIELEKLMVKEQPDWVLVYGDTNSTLAAALSAAKLHIPICHVEAGARTHCLTNPEEINRICTDHISSLLLTSTESGMKYLADEGLRDRTFMVGDPMYDAYMYYSGCIVDKFMLMTIEGEKVDIPEQFYYLTCHREENTAADKTLEEIFKAMESLDAKTIYPVHPRNKVRAMKLQKEGQYSNIILTEPVGYKESLYLVNHSIKIVTDSGGLQREAFFAQKKCVTILDFVCWPETMCDNRNTLAKPIANDILEKINYVQTIRKDYEPFGDGNAAKKIVKMISTYERMK